MFVLDVVVVTETNLNIVILGILSLVHFENN